MNPSGYNRARTWFFALLTLSWVGVSLYLVQELSPRPYEGSEADLDKLENYTELLDRQEDLLEDVEQLYLDIQETNFGIYQNYKIQELKDRIKDLMDPGKPMAEQRFRAGTLLNLLVDAREKFVTEQRNIVRIENNILNCQEGNQRYLDR